MPSWNISQSLLKNKQLQKDLFKMKNKRNTCSQLWYEPVINWNGNMLGCCKQFKEDNHFGNVFEKGFFKVFYGKKMNLARDLLKSKLDHEPKNIPCTSCIQRKR